MVMVATVPVVVVVTVVVVCVVVVVVVVVVAMVVVAAAKQSPHACTNVLASCFRGSRILVCKSQTPWLPDCDC